MRRSVIAIAASTLVIVSSAGVAFAFTAKQFDWGLPEWVPIPVVPSDNPMTIEKVELGRHLFYDKRLSVDKTMSCATCHQQDKAFTDGKSLSKGVTGEEAKRSAMTLVNVAYLPVLTWANPLLTSVEVQALIPIFGEHPIEMGMAGKEALLFDRIKTDPTYQKLFKKAFPQESMLGDGSLYSLSTITKALASFQRTLISVNSPYDRYRYGGQSSAITSAAKRGEALFFGEKMECYHCHGGFNFTDNIKHSRMPFPELGFHNTGLYNVDGKGRYPIGHTGIEEFTANPGDMGKFRTPTLRNIAKTAPYMHDGSIPDLASVIRIHYAKAGRSASSPGGVNPLRSKFMTGFQVTEEEVRDLVAFLESLTDEQILVDKRFSDPWR